MTFSKQYSNHLETIRIVIENINKNDAVKAKLIADDLYDDTKIQEGESLYTESVGFFNRRITRRGEVNAKSAESKRLKREIISEFVSNRKRLQAVFRDDPETWAAFGLDKNVEYKIGNMISQNINFYNAPLTSADLLSKASVAGITQPRLQAGLTRIQDYQTARTDYVSLRGTLQELTESRNKSVRKLTLWYCGLVNALRQIYKDNPQALESLGIFSRNKPVPKKKTDQQDTDSTDTTNSSSTSQDNS